MGAPPNSNPSWTAHCRHGRRRIGVARTATTALIVVSVLAGGASAAHASGRVGTGAEHPRSPIHGQPPPSAPVPTVTGPIAGFDPATPPTAGGVAGVTPGVLSAFGYQEKEFFVSGAATAFQFATTPATDGRWAISRLPGSASYETRIEVFTPTSQRRFSGNVIVEWDNVSAGFDSLPDLISGHDTMFRSGDAYVAVDAQFVGVESARLNDPGRYDALIQPGDSYSYDIFSQVGMAIWRDSTLLGGLPPTALIADGESQSASRLTSYIDAMAPVYNVYDGYLVHSRGAGSAPLQQAPGTTLVSVGPNGALAPTPEPNGNVGLTDESTPAIVQSRTDLRAPVLYFQTQSDVFSPPNGVLGYGPATQPDARAFRLWEVAGTAHADNCVNRCGDDQGNLGNAIVRFNDMLNPPTAFSTYPACTEPINTGEEGYTLGAAITQLRTWVVTGAASGGTAATSPPLFAGQFVGEGAATQPVLDAHGNIVGGVRSPAVDVPVATLTGVSTNTPIFCVLSGTTTAFTNAELQSLYPNHAVFAIEWALDVRQLWAQRYLTAPDAANLVLAAALSDVQ